MEVGLAILLFVCMTALLYVLLSLKITRQVDLQMKEFYKTRIHTDIQEFYREMEGYAALMENRIQRFKSLVERSEIASASSAAPPQAVQPVVATSEPRPLARQQKKKNAPQRKEYRAAPAVKKRTTEPGASKGTAASAPKTARQVEPKRYVPAVVRATPPVQPRARPEKVQPVQATPVVIRDHAGRAQSPAAEMGTEADTTIAEELMKDLFAQDEMQLSPSVKTAASIVQPREAINRPSDAAGESEKSAVSGIFARIGRALEPVVFGEKLRPPAAATSQTQQVSITAKAVPPRPENQTDFAEILRRAEQIKAEKKAERERAEIEARAEFYSAGDAFVPSGRSVESYPGQRELVAGQNHSDRVAAGSAAPRETQVRNSLAVKSLDEHTISFLIDSLKHDAGYRKQALRALTENNIPLDEIARLSRIDLGELQLMRQLGRF